MNKNIKKWIVNHELWSIDYLIFNEETEHQYVQVSDIGGKIFYPKEHAFFLYFDSYEEAKQALLEILSDKRIEYQKDFLRVNQTIRKLKQAKAGRF